MSHTLLFHLTAAAVHLLPAVVVLYLLLPTDRRCESCDGETLLLRPGPVGRLGARLLGRRIQHRWCPACGWEGFTRADRRRGAERSAGTRPSPPPRPGERGSRRHG